MRETGPLEGHDVHRYPPEGFDAKIVPEILQPGPATDGVRIGSAQGSLLRYAGRTIVRSPSCLRPHRMPTGHYSSTAIPQSKAILWEPLLLYNRCG
jgi:hypothetical protein